MTEIYRKLMNIQSALKAPKSQVNKFGNYNYRNCEDILEALKPLLKENEAAITLSDKLVQIGDRYYIEAKATLIDIADGSFVDNTAYAREEETKKGMDGSQITGSSSSYARKYALNGLFGIDDTKDSDATNTGKENDAKNTSAAAVKKITEAQLKRLFAIADEHSVTENQLKKTCMTQFGKEHLKDMTKSEYDKLVSVVERAPKTGGKA